DKVSDKMRNEIFSLGALFSRLRNAWVSRKISANSLRSNKPILYDVNWFLRLKVPKRSKICFSLLFIFYTVSLYAGEGTSTANFLKIGAGARSIAMGEAFTAVSDDVSAVYWNPAGLAQLKLLELSIMHNRWVEDINYQFVGYALPLSHQVIKKEKQYRTPVPSVLAVSAYYLSMEPIQGYYGKEQSDSSLWGMQSSKLTAYDVAGAVSYARQIAGRSSITGMQLFAGTTLKYVNKKLAGSSATGIAADASLLYLPGWRMLGGGWRFGLNLKNLGTGLKFEKETSPFPLDTKFGLAYTKDILGNNFIFSLDYSGVVSAVSAGAEYTFWDLITLRAGYKSSKHLDGGIRAGLGIGTQNVRFDYAFAPFGYLGETQRFSLSFKFGRKPSTLEAIQEMVRKHYVRGQRYYQKDDLINAYREFKSVVSFDPTHEESVKKVSEIESAFKEFKNQKEQAKRLKEIDKQLKIGKDYFNRGDFEKAKSQFQTVLQLQPEQLEAKEYLEKIEKEYEKWTKAEVRRLFGEVQILYSKGTYKDYQEALKRLERILELEPKNSEAAEKMKEIKQKISKIEEERKKEEEKKQKTREEERIQKLYKESINLYNKNKFEQAISGLKEVVEFYPGHKEALEYLKKSEAGLARKKEQDAAKSQEIYTEGVKEYTAGDIKKAVELWERALSLDSGNVKAQKSLERAREELKR
ncbi:MAG: PorV/PorQ family protein, partial [Elusimicrobiota bacterium]